MKTWAKWTLLILFTCLLLYFSSYWNPFLSFPAFLKYSVLSTVAAAFFGVIVILAEILILISVLFPLPPRADAKAPKSVWVRMFPFLYKKPPINEKAPTRLDELIGNDQAKQEIREVVDILMNPGKYAESGAVVPKGMLFCGPPGVGKTLFARAMANEIGVPFYVLEGSNISGIFFGLGVLKLKTLFRKIRKHDKVILFIDEIDSMGSRRGTDRGFGGVADMNMTLNTLLTEMDGFHTTNLMVIGATNNDGVLDPALMRPGRMDRRIYFQPPSPEERMEIFKYYLNKVKWDQQIDFEELAKMTVNFSPAEIFNVVNEAALISVRPGGPKMVTMAMIEQALDRISIGLERGFVDSGLTYGSTDARVRLDDVIGIDEAKQDILEIIDFLKHGEQLRKIGAKIPRGILLVGPPGVGKTMLAKAMANEANVPFYGISASSLFTSGRIKALYSQARKNPAAVIFIDEIDAIGAGSRDEVMNQILVELDGFTRSNVITIGATNNENELDPAFARAGRFDRKCYVGLPDHNARKKIFEKYLKDIQLASEPNLERLAKLTMNFSGADIAATVNEAAILAVRRGKHHVEEKDLEDAVDRVAVTAGHKLNTMGMNLSRVPDNNVKLSDVKGMDEAKAEAAEVVALMKNIDLITEQGLRAPRGILLVGPPGTGKTMLAKAIANEAGVPFYALSGGDFQSMWAGVGANRVRAVYEQARRSGKPCIVFIDEIDAIGGRRKEDLGGGAIQDSNKTLNQFLVELDGFGKHRVLTIGATNHPELLDPALLRPGRFDRQIDIPLPNLEGRDAIIRHYLSKVKTAANVRPTEIARMTTYSTGADLQNIVNEASLIAIRKGRLDITQEDLIEAVERESMGMAISRQVLTDELRATAYHEAGHAVVCYFRNRRDRIQIITVVPRGFALGYVLPVAKEDFTHKLEHEYLADIEVSLGGYCAEKLFLESTSSGVSSDLQQVGRIAGLMIREWGMGTFKFNTDVAFRTRGDQTSSETQREIELQIKKLVDGCMETVEGLLKAHRTQVDMLVHELLERETLYYRDIARILEPQRSDDDIERELAHIAERRQVGTPPIADLEAITARLQGTAGAPAANAPAKDGTNGNGDLSPGTQTASTAGSEAPQDMKSQEPPSSLSQ